MTTSTLTIRAARGEDEPFLLALSARLADFPVPAWRTPAEIGAADHEILLQALHHPVADSMIWLAEGEPGKLLGYVFATTRFDYFTKLPHAHVEILVLDSASEGRGVARALMDNAEDWARSRGYGRVTLNVFATNAKAKGLYEHLGYQPETVHYLKDLE
jgi:GNAT superfamily N-acetyltransferase